MGNVRFELDAESGKAVQAFLRVVDAQKKTEGGMKKIANEAKRVGPEFDRMARSMERMDRSNFGSKIGGVFSGMLATGAGALSLSRIVTGIAEAMEAANARTLEFHSEIKALGAMSGNIGNLRAFKSEVIGLSNAWGASTANIAKGMRQGHQRSNEHALLDGRPGRLVD